MEQNYFEGWKRMPMPPTSWHRGPRIPDNAIDGTIRNDGEFSLSRYAWEELGEPSHAYLAEHNGELAIVPCDREVRDSYKFSQSPNRGSKQRARLSAKGYFQLAGSSFYMPGYNATYQGRIEHGAVILTKVGMNFVKYKPQQEKKGNGK